MTLMPLWKGNIINYSWEFCKRETTCKGCLKVMVKGEPRLRTIQPSTGSYFKNIKYYCASCGDVIIRTKSHEVVSFRVGGVIEDSSKRRRFLRPVGKEVG